MTNEVDTVYSSGHSSSNMFVLSLLTDNALPHVGQFVLMREFLVQIFALFIRDGDGRGGAFLVLLPVSREQSYASS